jgi:hypothetical protein
MRASHERGIGFPRSLRLSASSAASAPRIAGRADETISVADEATRKQSRSSFPFNQTAGS